METPAAAHELHAPHAAIQDVRKRLHHIHTRTYAIYSTELYAIYSLELC